MDQISVAALLLGEEGQHLPLSLDKIRPSAQASKEEQTLANKYITRKDAVAVVPSLSLEDVSTKQRSQYDAKSTTTKREISAPKLSKGFAGKNSNHSCYESKEYRPSAYDDQL